VACFNDWNPFPHPEDLFKGENAISLPSPSSSSSLLLRSKPKEKTNNTLKKERLTEEQVSVFSRLEQDVTIFTLTLAGEL